MMTELFKKWMTGLTHERDTISEKKKLFWIEKYSERSKFRKLYEAGKIAMNEGLFMTIAIDVFPGAD